MDDIDVVLNANVGRSGFDGPPNTAPALTDLPPGVLGPELAATSESRDLLDIADGGRLTAAA